LTPKVGLLIAGAKERGELENRVTRLVQEAKDAGDVVLMCVARPGVCGLACGAVGPWGWWGRCVCALAVRSGLGGRCSWLSAAN
jgi:hypothetical protein